LNSFWDGRLGQLAFEFLGMKKAKRLNINFRAIPWPKLGDRLFKKDSDWWHNAQPTLPYLDLVGVRNLIKVMQRLDSFITAQITGIDFYLHESGN
jgi:hypothetical protein